MRAPRLMIAVAVTIGVGRQSAAQPNVPSSVGYTSPRFVPLDVWQRMLERPEDAPEAMVVEIDQDAAWAALETTFKELEVPVTFSDKAAGEMGMVRAKLYKRMGKNPISRYLRCGEGTAGPNAEMYVVYVSVLGIVRPAGVGKHLLYGMITGHAVDLPNGRNDVVPCTSSGQFEMLVVKGLNKRLGLKN